MANPRIPYQFSTSRPRLQGPEGKSIIVHWVVNVEHWRIEEPMPRTIVTPPHGKETVPDIPNFSWADYGMRCGLPRMLELFQQHQLPVSTSFNAGVIDAYPQAAEAMRDAGWEFIGHGMHQKSINHAGDEAVLLQAVLDKIAGFTGVRPRGWLSPGLRETWDTPEMLKACGVEYVCDWVMEDIPVWMHTNNGPLLAMPYNLELNDSIVHAIEKHSSDEMLKRLMATVACFARETRAQSQVRILPIGLHPHLMGVPHRIGTLHSMVDYLRARPEVCFMNGSQIHDWFVAQQPA